MKTVNKVKCTNDYTIFKTLEGNRTVNKLHVKRLINSFEKKYLISPIIVNEQMQIIDGQHRFEAAKELSLPIYFIIVKGYGLNEVQMLNQNTKNWTKLDYLNAYCDLNYPEYIKFRDFMNKFPDFGISACETILTDRPSGSYKTKKSEELVDETNKSGQYMIRAFQEGNLKISDYNKAVKNAEKIMMIKPYYNGFNRAIFVRAMIGIFKLEYYNHEQFISKLKLNQTALVHCPSVTRYKLLIEDIYNYRSRNKVSLRF